MKDQEIYDYFSSRKHSYDEMPPPELWNKISVHLQQSAPPTSWSVGKIIILLIAFAAVSAALVWGVRENLPKTKKMPHPTEEKVDMRHELDLPPLMSDTMRQIVTDTLRSPEKKQSVHYHQVRKAEQSHQIINHPSKPNFQNAGDTIQLTTEKTEARGILTVKNRNSQEVPVHVNFVKPVSKVKDSIKLDFNIRLENDTK